MERYDEHIHALIIVGPDSEVGGDATAQFVKACPGNRVKVEPIEC